MLSGIDISEFQGNIDWVTLKNNVNFVISKATEGVGFIDPWFGNNRSQARLAELPRGFYHFARPDTGNLPENEAQFFIDLMNGQPLQDGESIYLDYEVQYTGDNVAWALKWLQTVENALNVKPILYTYQSMLTSYDWTPVANNGNGLWIAAPTNDPNNNDFQTGAWSFAMMQQWGNQTIPGISTGVVDSDIFFGTEEEFKAYGYKAPQPETSSVVSVPPQDTTIGQPVSNPSTPINEVPETTVTPIKPAVEANQAKDSVFSTPPTNFPSLIKFLEWLIAKLKTM
jgi:lysozyme